MKIPAVVKIAAGELIAVAIVLLIVFLLSGCQNQQPTGYYLVDVQARFVEVDEAIEEKYDYMCGELGYTGVNFSGERWNDQDTISKWVATAYRFPVDREDVSYSVSAEADTPTEAAEILINQLHCISLPGEMFK